MLGTGQGGGECCGKAIGEVDPSTLGKNNLVKINGCCCCCILDTSNCAVKNPSLIIRY